MPQCEHKMSLCFGNQGLPMYIFKLRPEDTTYYDINVNTFETKTEKKFPYYRLREKTDDVSQFAVCPACNNPIQIIGLYIKLAHTNSPYGRHYSTSIPQLVEYHQENYDFCPLRKDRKPYSYEARKSELDQSAINIVHILVNHFDKVIYFIRKHIGIFISDALAKSMLRYYFTSKGYLYPGATLLNVPLMFAYFSGTYHLNGRIIFSGTLKKQLLDKKLVTFDGKKLSTFNDISFCFRNHLAELEDGHNLTEKLTFSIALKEKDGSIKNIYSQLIEFDPIYCRRLFNYTSLNESNEQKEHSRELINSARRIAEEFGFTVN